MQLDQPDACIKFAKHHEDSVDYAAPDDFSLEHLVIGIEKAIDAYAMLV